MRSRNPLSLAMVTYSALRASTIPARTILIDAASEAPSNVKTGSTRTSGLDRGLVPGATSDTGGSRPSHEKNTRMSSDPMMNSGRERERERERRSFRGGAIRRPRPHEPSNASGLGGPADGSHRGRNRGNRSNRPRADHGDPAAGRGGRAGHGRRSGQAVWGHDDGKRGDGDRMIESTPGSHCGDHTE